MTENQYQLYLEVKKLSKRANQRLVRLEQKNADTFAYNIAKKNINTYLKRNNNRFVYNKKMSYNDLMKERRAINNFLNSETSTVTGLKKVIKSREKTFNEKFGRDIDTMKNVYKFFKSKGFKKYKNLGLPSATLVSLTTAYTGDFRRFNKIIENSIKKDKSGGSILDDIERFIIEQQDTPKKKV